jgi:hypothetical protein
MRNIPFSACARPPDGVLFRDLNGESILLNLDSETYFGLDEVGTRMWQVLTTQPTIQAAFDDLCAEFDVDGEQLRRDLEELLDQLVAQRLLEVTPTLA